MIQQALGLTTEYTEGKMKENFPCGLYFPWSVAWVVASELLHKPRKVVQG